MASTRRLAPTAALEPLLAAEPVGAQVRGGALPERLRAQYGGDLAITLRSDRPTIVANFVSTLDGVVSYATPEAAGGGEISGFYEPDRYVMGLLRALADVVLIGAGTLRAAPAEKWTPEFMHPPSAGEYAALRRQLGLSRQPLTVVITASGQIDLSHPGLSDPRVPVLVLAGRQGGRELARRQRGAHVEIHAVDEEYVGVDPLIATLQRRAGRLVLCEGGPHLMGQLLSAGVLDELFLTLAPQIAGRSRDKPRLSLVEDLAFQVSDAPWARLVDLRRSGDHLFTRYRFERGS